MRAFCFRLLALWTALLPPAAHAQWPGAVEGRVIDAHTREGVEAATVGIPSLSLHTLTDASGRFRLRSLEPGLHQVSVERVGYAPVRSEVEVTNGRTAQLSVELVPVLELAPMTARVEGFAAGEIRVTPNSTNTLGARTAGDLLEGVVGVTVIRRGPGAAESLSIRGSSSDAVLVLLDGVPLNDPVTGEADLSSISAGAIRDITVLPGARSARHGPRAEAGVVVIRTGGVPSGPAAEGSTGSLGALGASLSWAGGGSGRPWDVSGSVETAHGRFRFEQDATLGGGVGLRENADLSSWSGQAGVEGELGGGRGRLRLRGAGVERGLPGRSFAPSPAARQEDEGIHLSGAWRGAWGPIQGGAELFGSIRRTAFRDPAPPTGLPYSEEQRARQVGGRGHFLLSRPPLPLDELGFGWELNHQSVRADALAGTMPFVRTDAGVFLTAGRSFALADGATGIRAAARVHRDGTDGDVFMSHDIQGSWTFAPLTVRLAHRSSFSPPTLADRFFRAGVGVEPNPGLRAERVPSELEAGMELGLDRGAWRLGLSVSVYRGDVRDMIVWSPDYRFVWSPRNVDVLRRGSDLSLTARAPLAMGSLEVSSTYSLARVTYDRSDGESVQVRYRPRHSGSVTTRWRTAVSTLSLGARYTGSRLPVPADVNRLPGFWSFEAAVSAGLQFSGWWLEPYLRLDRLLDTHDSMIFAFPEPGRTFRIGASLSRSPRRRPLP